MFQQVQWEGRVRAVMACLVASLVICAGALGPAHAEDDDEMLDVKFFRSVLRNLGLKRGDGAGIDYRERSPLVVPPSTDLPVPENPALVERNPEWPVDPDVARHRQAATRKKRTANWEEEGRALTPAELNKGVPRGGPAPGIAKSAEESMRQLPPSELGFKGFDNMRELFGFGHKTETRTFESEPRRTDLTQPPPGYLTPSTDQPYGLGKDTTVTKPENPMDHAVGSDR
ncbi:MAG: hypothetical protein R3D52_13050 [Xanthobacteraceae bacterium]